MTLSSHSPSHELVRFIASLPAVRESLPDATTRPAGHPQRWNAVEWRAALRGLPFDSGTFLAEYQISWDDAIKRLHTWCLDEPDPSEPELEESSSDTSDPGASGLPDNAVDGFLGLTMLTLLGLSFSEQRRTAASAEASETTHDDAKCNQTCHRLTARDPVRHAFREIYAPDPERDGKGEAASEWALHRSEHLYFHEHGTTSFVLKVRRIGNQNKDFALKCILLPFQKVESITEATRNTFSTYGGITEADHLAVIWSSYDSWVVMDFIQGRTLAELIQERTSRTKLDIEMVRRFGPDLFDALDEMDRFGLVHEDLSPANIIVVGEGDTKERLCLIDLGVNSLYLHKMPGRDAPDARYIAPEVRENDKEDESRQPTRRQSSDLYSLGQLMILLCCGSGASVDGNVPDILYVKADLLARFIEDLIDRNPVNRLKVFSPEEPKRLYESLGDYFNEELTAIERSYGRGAWFKQGLLGGVQDIFSPMSGAVMTQIRLWRVRRRQPSWQQYARALRLRWLTFCAVLSAAIWAACTWLIYTWLATYHNVLPGGSELVEQAKRATNQPNAHLEDLFGLKINDYGFLPGAHEVALGIVMMSFLLVGVKYYQTLFAGLTPLVVGWRQGKLTVLAVVSELFIRQWTISPLILIGLIVLRQPKWWSLVVAVGMTLLFFSNVLSHAFARMAMRRAREKGLSVPEPDQVIGLEFHKSWVVGNIFHSLTLWAIGWLLFEGVAKDARAYIILLVLWNVQLYIGRAVMQGPAVRGAMARGCAAAERLRLIS